MENEDKRKIKRKNINQITDEDIYSYSFNSENLSPNIRALPVRKKDRLKKRFSSNKYRLRKSLKTYQIIFIRN